MRSAKVSALLLCILAASLISFLPASSSDSDVTGGDVMLSTWDDNHPGAIAVNAGTSKDFKILVTNTLPAGGDMSSWRMVTIVLSSESGVTMSIAKADQDFLLKGQESHAITVTVLVGRYAGTDTYDLNVSLNVKTPGITEPVPSDPLTLKLNVLSPLSSGSAYNKILGVFDNPLPAPFDGPATSALITFLFWLMIGTMIVLILVPLLLRIFAKEFKDEGAKLKKGLRMFVPLVLVLFAFDNSLRVIGADEEIIGSVESWFNVFYIILGAMIFWKVYTVFVHYTASKISKNKRIGHKDVDIGPLMRLIGKIVIAVASITMIMSSLGFNLTAIITSAGIVSLGITLGAQNILNQFFSGMVLLMTHPFRSGDLVKIGASNTIYKVSSVNLMNTVFQNWDNEEEVIMPNNAVSSSTIVNLTGEGLIYKVTVSMNIGYDADVDKAKQIMQDVATNHPNIITNGSVGLPYTRVTAFNESSIEVKLVGYVYDFNDSGRIGGELRESIYKAFRENGIHVPLPQMDVHLDVVHREDLKKDANA